MLLPARRSAVLHLALVLAREALAAPLLVAWFQHVAELLG
jgi:hypothetical protein